MKKRKQKHSALYKALSALCVILGLVFVTLLSGTLYLNHLLGQLNYVDSQVQMAENPEASEPAQPAKQDSLLDSIFGEKNPQVNILLIGQDRRPGEERARSDSMILCTFQKESRKLTMTSIMRDLYVPIPGYEDNRINSAYAFGGMGLLNDTLEQNFGIRVDGNVEVDFNQFSQIIDLLGGVALELRADEANYLNQVHPGSGFTAGTHTLNGEQALTYARIRSLDADADFSRTGRQRKVLNSLIEHIKGASLVKMMGILNQILPNISTDLSKNQIVGYAVELFPMLPGMTIESQRIPVDGAYQGRMIRGMSVLVPDMEATRQFLSQTLGMAE